MEQQHHRHPGSGERELDKLRKTIEEYRIKAEASGGMTSSHEPLARIMSSPLHHHHHHHHEMSPFSPEASPRVRDYHNHLAHQRRQSTVVTSSTTSAADHRDKRVSSGSLSSMSSHASHSSVSSSSSATSIEGDHSKHGKKKRWQLPIKSAFSRSSKSSQSSGIHECGGELTMGGGDELVSPVSSHNADHDAQQNSATNLVMASSGGSVDAKTYNEALMLIQEKDRKLTDVRLEALMTQHQLHQLHDQIEQMQHEMQLLRMENERLTSSHQADKQSPSTIKSLFSSPPSSQSSSASNAFRISPLTGDSPTSCGTFLRRNSATGNSPTVASSVAPGTSPHKHLHLDCSKIRRLVSADHGANRIRFVVPNVGGGSGSSTSTLAYQQQHADCTVIGSLPVARNITWDELDKMTCDVFTDYCLCVDGESRLGLSSSSIAFYQVGDQTRMIGSSPPQLLPCAFIVGNVDSINISLKDGASAALDLLSFRTLIPKNVMQRYALNLLQRKQIILHGSSGTGKTFLAKSFARFLLNRQRRSLSFEEGVSVVDWKKSGAKALGAYVREMAGECERGGSGGKSSTSLPHVLIVDNCPTDRRALNDVFGPMFALDESVARPYIIGTSGDVKVEGDNETAAADKFYWISCLNKSAHVKDFLSRYLRRSVIEKEIVESRRGGGGGDDDDGERENLLRVVTWLPLCWHHVNRNLDGIGLSDVRVGPHVFTPLPLDFSTSCHWFIKTWNTIIVPFVTTALKRAQPSSKGGESKWTDPTTWVMNSFPWNSSDMGCDYSLRLMRISLASGGSPPVTNPPIPPKSETVRQQVNCGVAAKKDISSGVPRVISPPPIPPRPDTETTRRFSQHRRTMARRLSNGEVITEVEAAPPTTTMSSRADIWHPRNR